jgi:hypothetical protein
MSTPAKLTASAPVLLVKDVVKAANHYRDAMGFGYERFWGEPPSFVILHRDGMYVMLKQAYDPKHVVPHWTVSAAENLALKTWMAMTSASASRLNEQLASPLLVSQSPCLSVYLFPPQICSMKPLFSISSR